MQIKKKEYTPFPPPQLPSKVDLQLESGEYFLSKETKASKAEAAIQARQALREQTRRQQRQQAFQPPQATLLPLPICCILAGAFRIPPVRII